MHKQYEDCPLAPCACKWKFEPVPIIAQATPLTATIYLIPPHANWIIVGR